MPNTPSPLLAIQSSSTASNSRPSFIANILPVRASAAYPVNASSRYWNPESLAPSKDAPVETLLRDVVVKEGSEAVNREEVKEGGALDQERRKGDGMKIAYFRGRKLLGKEVRLGDMGCRGSCSMLHFTPTLSKSDLHYKV